MGELRIIGRSPIVMFGDAVEGELRLIWSNNNAQELDLAQKTFDEYINKGWIAVAEVSGKKMQIFTFNPDLETIVLSPLTAGG